MKKLLMLFLIILPVLFACKKENNSTDIGIITGTDMRECVCCGGWFIEINDSSWLFKELPTGSNLDLVNANFPLKVELKWQKNPEACLPEDILVNYIRKK